MKLIIQNNRIAATATDDYIGADAIAEPVDFDVLSLDKYRMANGVLVIPAPSEPERVAALWQAAHDYEYAQVSGSAIGLLAIGVMRAMPKCLAVQNWIKSIWAEYYARKAAGSVDYDFSVIGLCPHTVPELMTELGL